MDGAEFSRLVCVVHDVRSSADDRHTAHQALDAYRDGASNPSAVAFDILAGGAAPAAVQLAALNFVEFTVRYKWSRLSPAEQEDIRRKCSLLLASAAGSGAHVGALCTGVTRCVVELAKRQWPAPWHDFHLQALAAAQRDGRSAHVVCHVMLRLCEDVCLFHSVEPAQRRRALHAAIVDADETLWGIVNVALRGGDGDGDGAEDTVKAALSLCAILLDVLPADGTRAALVSADTRLLANVCAMLDAHSDGVKVAAAGALAAIADRKGAKRDDASLSLLLFNELPVNAVLAAAHKASAACELMDRIECDTPNAYVLLRELCALLPPMAGHLCAAIASVKANKMDACDLDQATAALPLFLDAAGAFLSHPSVRVNLCAVHALHSLAAERPSLLSAERLAPLGPAVCLLAQKTADAIVAAADADRGGDAAGKADWLRRAARFARADYDDRATLHADCTALRTRCLRLAHECCADDASQAGCGVWLALCAHWIDTLTANCDDVAAAEWDGMTRVCKQCFDTASKRHDYRSAEVNGIVEQSKTAAFLLRHWDNLAQLAARLLDRCQWKTLDRLLSVQSSLFVVLPVFPDRMPPFLQHIFRVLCASASGEGESDLNLAKRHCCANLVYMVTSLTQTVLPHASALLSQCGLADGHVTLMQRGVLYQVPMLLANYLHDFAQRKACWQALVANSVAYLKRVEQHLVSAESLVRFLGWTDDATSADNLPHGPYSDNRKALRGHVHLLHGLLNQFKPVDACVDVACLLCILEPCLNSVFGLLRCVHAAEAAARLIHASHGGERVFGITSGEIQAVSATLQHGAEGGGGEETQAGGGEQCRSAAGAGNDALEAARVYYASLMEATQCCAGCIAAKLFDAADGGCAGFYAHPAAAQYLALAAAGCLEHVSDHRLRWVLRRVWRPMLAAIAHADGRTHAAVLPAARLLLNYMADRLRQRWAVVLANAASERNEEEGVLANRAEVFFEHVTTVLAREWVATVALLVLPAAGALGTKHADKAAAVDNGRAVSGLAAVLLEDAECVSPLVAGTFNALSWPDAPAIGKTVRIAHAIVAHLTSAQWRQDTLVPPACHQLVLCVLRALAVHGADDALASQLTQLLAAAYVSLRARAPDLRSVLMQIPDCTAEQLDVLDRRLAVAKDAHDKSVREQFKKLVKPILGTPLCERFALAADRGGATPAVLRRRARARPRRTNAQVDITAENGADGHVGLCKLFAPDTLQ